jgi:hypothetical protein
MVSMDEFMDTVRQVMAMGYVPTAYVLSPEGRKIATVTTENEIIPEPGYEIVPGEIPGIRLIRRTSE